MKYMYERRERDGKNVKGVGPRGQGLSGEERRMG
jgi:hypothetical protein